MVYKKNRKPDSQPGFSQEETDRPDPVELVSLLQDTSLLCSPAVNTHELPDALTAPLTL